MKLQTRAQDHRAARPPSRAGDRGSQRRPHPARAARLSPARPRGRRCGERQLQSHRQPGPNPRSAALARSTPPFGLTLRAMLGMRHHFASRQGRSAVLLSVSVLLAFACFPLLAQAQDGSGIEYSSAPPTATGLTPAHPQKTTPHSSTANGGATASSGSGGSTKSSGSGTGSSNGNRSSGSGNATNPGAKDTGGQGSPDKSQSGDKKNAQQSGQGGTQSGTPTSSSSGGDSSPLVPILIVVAVLAAISVGVVMARQRRQRRGGAESSVSPKAS